MDGTAVAFTEKRPEAQNKYKYEKSTQNKKRAFFKKEKRYKIILHNQAACDNIHTTTQTRI